MKICAVHSPVSGGLAASTSVPLSRARSASRRGRARPETAFREPACIPREAGGLASANHRPRARGAAVRAFRQRHARGIARPHEVGVTRARPPRQITHAQIARRCGHGALQQLLSRIAPLSATAHLAGCGRPLPERLGHTQLALRSDSEICALCRKALAARCAAAEEELAHARQPHGARSSALSVPRAAALTPAHVEMHAFFRRGVGRVPI